MNVPGALLLEASLVELCLRQLTEENSLLQLQASITVWSSHREMEFGATTSVELTAQSGQ